MLRLWWGPAELISGQLNSYNLLLSRRKISSPWRGHSSDSQGRSSWGCVCCLSHTRDYCADYYSSKGAGAQGRFSNIRGSGSAWEGWITSLEMEKQFHFKCQAPKLVGLRLFSSHPWGDLCPLKNPLWSSGLLCCSTRWPLLVPIWSTGSSAHRGRSFPAVFPLGLQRVASSCAL